MSVEEQKVNAVEMLLKAKKKQKVKGKGKRGELYTVTQLFVDKFNYQVMNNNKYKQGYDEIVD